MIGYSGNRGIKTQQTIYLRSTLSRVREDDGTMSARHDIWNGTQGGRRRTEVVFLHSSPRYLMMGEPGRDFVSDLTGGYLSIF